MKLNRMLTSAVSALALAAVIGCGSSRDVEVEGEVMLPRDVSGPLRVEFYEGAGDERELVYSTVLDDGGPFTETVPLEGDEFYVLAVVDRDNNEACTDGEPWGEVEATVEDDKASVSLAIAARAACPALPVRE
jgi:hypothetical protein